jgi:hypothetical protein
MRMPEEPQLQMLLQKFGTIARTFTVWLLHYVSRLQYGVH